MYFGTSANPALYTQTYNKYYTIPSSDTQEGVIYYWKIVATDTEDAFSESPVWSFTTKTNLPPVTPYQPNPMSGLSNVSEGVSLSWYCSDPENTSIVYDLYFGTSAIPPHLIQTVNKNYTISSILTQPGEKHYWKVVATDASGASTEGPVWNFTTFDSSIQNFPWYYDFDEYVPATGWSQSTVISPDNWPRASSTTYPSGYVPKSGCYMAGFFAYVNTTTIQARLETPIFNLTTVSTATFNFSMFHDNGYSANLNSLLIQVSVNDGQSWVTLGSPYIRYDTTVHWSDYSVDLSAYAGQTIKIGFLAKGNSNNIYIDDLSLIAN